MTIMSYVCNFTANKTYSTIYNKRPFVNVSLTGNLIKALVDSGACVTAINDQVFRRIQGRNKYKRLDEKERRFAAANGDTITVEGKYLIPIIINRRTYYQETWVIKNLTTEMILGIDFITKSGMIINGKTRKVIIGDEVINERFCDGKTHTTEISGINEEEYFRNGSLVKKIEIPGHTLCTVEVKTPTPFGDEEFYCQQPLEGGRPDLIVYDGLTRRNEKGDKVKVMVGNISIEPLILDEGIKVAHLIPLKHSVKIRHEEPGINSVNPDVKPKEPPIIGVIQRFDFLKKIKLECPSEYKARYQNLFVKYHDVFSKSEYDLGRTDKISHRIKLKHEKPINIKQFKIPIVHQEAIHEFVEEMMD